MGANKQALRSTFVGDKKKFTNYDRVAGKSPLTRKKELLNQTVQGQLKIKQEYTRQV